METVEVDVVVVGAGLSGLMAATRIQQTGLSCIVLEATGRVGGKTLTVPASSQGGLVDVGAAWINDTNQSYMFALAQRFMFDLKVQRTHGTTLFEDAVGDYHELSPGEAAFSDDRFFQAYERRVEECSLEHPEKSPDAHRFDNISFERFAEQFSSRAVDLANIIAKGLLGEEASEMSALYMFNYIRSGTGLQNMLSDGKDGGQYLRNRQGNQTFSTRLVEQLKPGTVILHTPVRTISRMGEDAYTVGTTGNATYGSRRVVVSVPTCLYPNIEFSPPLPEAKRQLSENTALGFFAKMILVYSRPWWHDLNLSGSFLSLKGPVEFTRDTCIEEDNQFSITCFLVGDRGRMWSKRPKAVRRKLVVDQMNRAFATQTAKVPQPINIVEQDWSKEPWIWGIPSPIMPPGLLTSEAGTALRCPAGNIHFIGTETAVVWKGYMEGAVRSGIRGAAEVVEALAPSDGNIELGALEL